jgi:hypothetical protein
MIRYDEHAEFQIARRGIDKSFLKCLPGRHIMLRVVTAENDLEYVITAYFDRKRPCA